MSLDDNALKRWQKFSEEGRESEVYHVNFGELKALLARLEAAEQCCNHDTESCEREFDGCYQCKLIKAWRKAAGK